MKTNLNLHQLTHQYYAAYATHDEIGGTLWIETMLTFDQVLEKIHQEIKDKEDYVFELLLENWEWGETYDPYDFESFKKVFLKFWKRTVVWNSSIQTERLP